ncbi:MULTISPECIES: bifunctional oligoribonuclease/PAP phosphatase NrnA [unclassified Ruminococcus]|uniref:DHH family phosphoesterase n=1 Tax=unclassified Ruminococcus TaxID=2608920 RepID=UPI00210C9945|nr:MULTISPECIES: DHH family phosphoesterase [unclassified Ruminococcus]MCQ4023015.1 bifunctional oligoribonuclease/PAP phosphatase NrnA [Ruminococcus sp. zg-924]MCQ4115452.1 bifunctional oligoribonuclease/PAP phosphatase NrnA [Ruminococcus sp. zg-921]
MEITIEQAAKILKERDNVLLLTHMSPDGDTLGCAFALCRALQLLGKKARVSTEGEISKKFLYLCDTVEENSFDEELVVAVDIADEKLFPENSHKYRGRVDLCVDHHVSNTHYAKDYCVEPTAAACAEVTFKLVKALGIEIDRPLANCIFTGLTTDTGCFRYSNVTKQTMNTAAQLIESGCDSYIINKLMFETNSRERIALEQMSLSTLEYYDDGKIAVMTVTLDMLEKSGASDSELDGIAAIPRTIEGVLVGILIKQKSNSLFKVSVRSDETVCSASELCSNFGGGGHAAAGGCAFNDMPLEEIKKQLVEYAEKLLAIR